MAGMAKPSAIEAFEANLADAKMLVGLSRALENRRVYRIPQAQALWPPPFIESAGVAASSSSARRAASSNSGDRRLCVSR